MNTQSDLSRALKKWSFGLAAAVLVGVLLVLLGWSLEIEGLRRPIPHFVTMNPLTAFLLALLLYSFFLLIAKKQNKGRRTFTYALILFVLSVAAYKLLETVFKFPIQIDKMFFAETIKSDLALNRLSSMAPNTTINLILLCISLLLLFSQKTRKVLYSQLSALAVSLMALFSILGYIYSVPEFYGMLPYFPMSIQAASFFLSFSLAILLANPQKGLIRIITSQYSGSLMARVLIPYVILIPLLIGYVTLWGHGKGVISTEFGVAILVVSFISIFVLLVLISASSLNRKDVKGKSFTHKLEYVNVKLRVSNEDLQVTLKELEVANEKLTTSNEYLVTLNKKLNVAKEIIQSQTDVIIQQKDEQLDEYRKNLDIIFNNTQEGIILLDRTATVILFNRAFENFKEKVSGKKPTIGKSLLDVVVDERKELTSNLFAQALNGKASRTEVSINSFDGVIIHALRYEPIWQHGNVTHVSIISSDITEKKEQENILLRSEANLRSIFENTLDSYLLLSSDLKILAFNQVYFQAVMIQIKKALKIGSNLMEYLSEERQEAFQLMLTRVKNGEVVQYDTKLGSDSEPKWFNITITQVKGASGDFLGYCISAKDNTQVKKAELELRKNEELFRAIVENSDDIFVMINAQINIFYASPSFTRILGYSQEEILAMHRGQVIHPDDQHQYALDFEKAIKNRGLLISIACRVRHKDGRWLRVEGTSINLFHVENVNCIISTYRDVTSRYQVAKEIEKLSLVASNTDNSVVILDNQGCIEWVNNSFTKLTGFGMEEVKNKSYISFMTQSGIEQTVIGLVDKKLKHFESVAGELTSYSKDGRAYWTKLSITPVLSNNGDVTNFVSVQSDISSQKEYENEITTIAKELRSLIENSNVPIFGVDRNGYINEWNLVTAEVTEFTKNEVLGKKLVNTFIEPKYQVTIVELLKKIVDGISIDNFELPFLTKRGERKILLLSASPRMDINSENKGVILVAQNITELIAYRQGLEKMVQSRTRELNEALQKERELVEMKSKFVSIVSHEFRTPLSSISLATGFIKRYKQKITQDDLDKKLESIENQVLHMNHLLEDVLTIGKAEAGKIQLNLTEIVVDAFFDEIINDVYSSTNRSHEIKLTMNCAANVFISDPRMIRIILINLLTNAIKFSPESDRVSLNIFSNEDALQVEVVDSGLGIPESDIENLFDSFHRGSNISEIEGTGLGLSIVRKTVDLLQGSITVKSKVSEGTMFTIFIPIKNG